MATCAHMATCADLLYCKSLPKIELHAHLNGSISVSTMHKLLEKKASKTRDLPETWQTTIAKGQKRTLEECFQVFKIIHALVDDTEAVSMVAHDVVREFAADGVVYIELRSTPKTNEESGMTKTSYIDSVIRGIKSALGQLPNIHVRLLLSIDRRQSIAEAMDTVMLAEQYSKSEDPEVRVVGVDLSGDPRAGDMKDLLPVLKMVKEKNLKLTLHLSEIPAHNEETLMLLRGCSPDRIGHGTFLHPDVGGTEDIVQEVVDRAIPIEMCLSSNLISQTVLNIDNHHFKYWKPKNHPIILCTDDKGVFSTCLSEEYHLAARTFALSKRELWEMSLTTVNYIFESSAFKEQLRKLWPQTLYPN